MVILSLKANKDVFLGVIEHRPRAGDLPVLPRSESTSEIQPLEDKEVEYFFASDASAVIEHTNRVIYLEVYLVIFATIIKPIQGPNYQFNPLINNLTCYLA